MSKELTPLQVWEIIKSLEVIINEDCDSTLIEDLPKSKIIEIALKEKEQQDGVLKILKEIIEFAQMLPQVKPNKDNGFDIMSAVGINVQRDIENKERELLRKWVLETCFPKELKALEIIKEKRVNVFGLLTCKTVDEYNNLMYHSFILWKLSQEEYDLLKEVLE